jgi:hypothetical protein
VSGDDGRSAATHSVHVGDDGRVICHTYKWTTPILVVSAGSASVCISIKGGHEDMPAPAVAFARDLAASAQRFAIECERLHTMHEQASTHNSGPTPVRVSAGGSQ